MTNIFFELHNNLPRQGPGIDKVTELVLNMLPNISDHPSVLDIGCGPGMQTIVLAKQLNGTIIALDNHQPFLDELEDRAKREGVKDKINIINGSMFEVDFDEKFDIIWSEGAMYIMGFEKGLQKCKQFLKSGGYIAVSEVSWLKRDIPKEPFVFWTGEYPDIRSIHENVLRILDAGYNLIGVYVLPPSGWWDNYYIPLEEKIKIFRIKYKDDEKALKILEQEQYEIDLYRKYSAYYGYVFYVMQFP